MNKSNLQDERGTGTYDAGPPEHYENNKTTFTESFYGSVYCIHFYG